MREKININLIEIKKNKVYFELTNDMKLTLEMIKFLNEKGEALIEEKFKMYIEGDRYVVEYLEERNFNFFIETIEYISNPIYVYLNLEVYGEEFFLINMIIPVNIETEFLKVKDLKSYINYNNMVQEEIKIERKIVEEDLIYEIIEEDEKDLKIKINLKGVSNGKYKLEVKGR